jgi:hypothetical protein
MSYTFFKQEFPGTHQVSVTLYNDKNNAKPATVTCSVDSGSWSIFDNKVAQDLGIDVTKGYHYYEKEEEGERYYLHRLPLQIGGGSPVIADVYFGDLTTAYTWVSHKLPSGHIGWANNGGLNNYIIDYDVNNVGFTDYSYINSLPNPVNRYTVLKFKPPRLSPRYTKIILYNSFPYIEITCYNKITNAPKTVNLFIDSASTFTVMKETLAKDILGYSDITVGGKELVTLRGQATFYRHKVMVKIGDLSPREFTIGFVRPGDMQDYEQFPDAILGQDNLDIYYKLRFMRDRIMFQENPSAFGFRSLK